VSGSQKYVCAFRGRRDYYQVPLALNEAGILDEFITDAYFGPLLRGMEWLLPKRLREKARFRQDPGLPAARVKCLWGATVVEHLRHQLGCAPSVTWAKLDRRFSLAAAARARKTKNNLFLYSSYAWEAFTARYPHTPRRILFQFHPHPDLERRLLLEDRTEHPFVKQSFEEEAGEHLTEELGRRVRECWRHADLIICASTFTKRSLIEAGADASLCKIVPYGIEMPVDQVQALDQEQGLTIPTTFQVLFVGSGTQRKGLHHLLLAWSKATLPHGSTLTLVCRVIDPGIQQLLHGASNVELIRGLQRHELEKLFRASSLLVMPSLVEGFGQVYLEALAQGCPVLGTPNTCLPDLNDNNAGAVNQVQAGQIDQLISALEGLSSTLPGDKDIRERARASARSRPWSQFRDGIRRLTVF
jgi:glycosyltransferase involved in cell wall biosynthesis